MAHIVAQLSLSLAAHIDTYVHQAAKSADVGAPRVTHKAFRGSVREHCNLNSAQQLNYSKQKALQAHMRVLHEPICVAPANNNK